jgi:hypothetical protein
VSTAKPERAFRRDRNEIGPRLRFAYRLGGERDTVMRGAAGVFYGPAVSDTIGDAAAPGVSTAANWAVSQAEVRSALELRMAFRRRCRRSRRGSAQFR